MIDAVVHEKSRNAAQKTPRDVVGRFGPKLAAHGYVVEQKFAIATSATSAGACRVSRSRSGVNGMIPVLKQP